MHSRAIRSLILTVSIIAFAAVAAARSSDPIRIGLSQQTGQQIIAHIAARVLERAGFKFEFVAAAADDVAPVIAGDVHFNPALVVTPGDTAYAEALRDGRIYSLGGLGTNDPDEPAQKVIWSGVRSNWPYAERMLKTMIVPPQDLETLAASVDAGTVTLDEAVDGWMANNRAKWKRWLTGSRNWMKP